MADIPAEPELTREEVQTMLESRSTIEQAKGILMERYGLGSDAAFAVLVRHSQHTNRKVLAVAAELVSSGALPEDPIQLKQSG